MFVITRYGFLALFLADFQRFFGLLSQNSGWFQDRYLNWPAIHYRYPVLLRLAAYPAHYFCIRYAVLKRHNFVQEIIVKAVSAILLLLLKHFKINHVYQVNSSLCNVLSHLFKVKVPFSRSTMSTR